jgi:hypothetical protein
LANPDRHFNNFGIIRNVENLEEVRIAPLWDNDLALFAGRLGDISDEWDYSTNSFIARPQLQLMHCVKSGGDWYGFDAAALAEKAKGLLEAHTGYSNTRTGAKHIERLVAGIEKRAGYIEREIYHKPVGCGLQHERHPKITDVAKENTKVAKADVGKGRASVGFDNKEAGGRTQK